MGEGERERERANERGRRGMREREKGINDGGQMLYQLCIYLDAFGKGRCTVSASNSPQPRLAS